MKKTINKLLILMLACVSAICFVFAITSSVNVAKAEAIGQFGVKNAAVYLGTVQTDKNNDDSGIRFNAEINQKAYNDIKSKAGDVAVFFGIELTVNGANPKYICYTTSDATGLTGFNEISFASEAEDEIYNYTATIMYNKEQLAEDLKIPSDGELIEKYLQAAYKTEITAKAYYQIGGEGDKVIDDSSLIKTEVTRSIWGVGAKTYVDAVAKGYDTLFDDNGDFILLDKYFSSVEIKEGVKVDEYGAITGYDQFEDTDKVYLDAELITITDGKIDKELVGGLVEGEVLSLCIVKADGSLINLNAEFEMQAELIEREAIYDATENIIYYTDIDGNVQKVTDGTFSYVGENSIELSKGLVSYLYNDAFEFGFGTKGNYKDHSMLSKLAPRIGTEKVEIAYNPATDTYSGVTVIIEKDGIVLYKFTNVVIASQVIDDATELKQVFNKKDNGGLGTSTQVYDNNDRHDQVTYTYGNITKGMYVLVDDIDASTGFKFDNSYFNFFEGVFDGRGHNIYNLDVSVDESTGQHGNGLFSAISTFASIQNIGFINVKANNGAVFMGNTVDRPGGVYRDSAIYREQVGLATDGAADLILTVLKSVRRAGEMEGSTNWSNVYVKVSDDTTKLMGVISRNMPNKPGILNAANLVIEYTPTDESAYTNYNSSGYGVLFGGAYRIVPYGKYSNLYFDAPQNYFLYDNTASANVVPTYYTPTTIATPVWDCGSLNFSMDSVYDNSIHGHTVFVVSPIKLVSSAQGAILAMNEIPDESNPYQFQAQNESSRIMRYDNRDEDSGLTASQLNAYINELSGLNKYWDINNGHLVWKNIA